MPECRTVSSDEAQARLFDILSLVAHDRVSVLITDEGHPLARLVPCEEEVSPPGWAGFRGWLDDDDPFFLSVREIVEARAKHLPRVLSSPGGDREP